MNLPKVRQVLDCASPLALWYAWKSGRGLPHSKTLSRNDQALESSWPQCAVGRQRTEQRQSLSVSNLWGINLFSIVTLALACSGCAGYRLGPTSPDATRGKSIQINFFKNQTLEPRLVEAVNHALRKNVQQDGTYRLNTRGDGDVIVNGVIVSYLRQGLSFQPTDTLTIRDYQVTLVTKITAIERGSGKVMLDREVTGRTTVRSGSDLPSAERQALSLLADDLAKNATTLLAEGKW
jgi:lipopolysaccharide assembly LptE-like protein